MKKHVYCPGCGFRGKLPASLGTLTSVVCPQCRTTVPVEQLDNFQRRTADPLFPIRVDPSRADLELPPLPEPPQPVPPRPRAVAPPPPPRPRPAPPPVEDALPVAEEVPDAPPEPPAPPTVVTRATAPTVPDVLTYEGDFMKAEAARFEQYVNARLAEVQKKRAALAEAESKFEQITMAQKQELGLSRAANTVEADKLKARDAELSARAAELVARESALAVREAELAARDQQAARIQTLATEQDRRFAELRATLDRIEAKRAALAEERAELDRRASELDSAEIELQRRGVEMDEMEVRLREALDEARAAPAEVSRANIGSGVGQYS
jgi:hypothetical protein